MSSIPNAVANQINQIIKCSDSTFLAWKSGMKMFFMGAGAGYFCQDPPPTSVPTGSEELDKQMTFFIWSSLEKEVKYLVEGKMSGLEAYKAVV